jgi:amino acid adenylation domain-containing protein
MFDKGQATGIAHTLKQAISGLMSGFDGQIKDISLLSDVDRSQIYIWNQYPPQFSDTLVDTVDRLIHRQCLAQPSAPAVCAWNGEFSYQDLDYLSSALAKQLMMLNVGPEVFVPLCFEKSRWTTVAMLGVIKAGAAFVLLDASHPLTRLQNICQAVSAKVIIASARQGNMATNLAAKVLTIEDSTPVELEDTSISFATTNNPLYAVFTSGSTGVPKGVVSEHSSFNAAIRPYVKALGLTRESRVFQFASYAFDVIIFDTLMTLLSGGCVCVPSDDDRWSDVTTTIGRFRATHTALTPTVARILDPNDLPTLTTMTLGGEKLAANDVNKWLNNVSVVHLYGASECTIISLESMTKTQTTDHTTGNACWIVHPQDHERLLPIGAVGELMIEGAMAARCYLNEPEKTAATFIQRPSWLCQIRDKNYQGRLYKTGDLARYTASGGIQVVGRKDAQVKLRGQRVELGEVEHNIRLALPQAKNVVAEVVHTPDASRLPTLVAFIHEDQTGHDTTQILAEPTDSFRSQMPLVQSQLGKALPAYMVPAIFFPLSFLPLTATDKTDRKLLRQLAASLSREQWARYQPGNAVKRAPQTAMEKLLQKHFSQVLNLPLEKIGAEDHFFRCGGDSLTAMQLVAAVGKESYKITVQDVLNNPQLSALSRIISPKAADDNNDDDQIPPEPFALVDKQKSVIRDAAQQCHLPVRLIEDIYPCTPLQQGLFSETMRAPEAFVAEIVLDLAPDIDLQHLQAAWKELAKANHILRTRMVLSSSHGLLQVVVREDIRWTESESGGSDKFVVGTGKPLVRLTLCRRQHSSQLVLNIHHSVYDGWSLPLLFAEVEAAYQGKSLVAHPVSPFIRYLQSTPDGAPHWNSTLDGFKTPEFPELPSGTYKPCPLTTKTTNFTTSISQGREFPPNIYIRLAWALTQARNQENRDVVFGTVVSGRSAPVAGIQSMTTPTVATIPCRVTLDGSSTVLKALQSIQNNSSSAIPFEQTGLANIRRLGDDAARACSFQTLLVTQPAIKPRQFSWLQQHESTIDYRADATYAINLFSCFDGDNLEITAVWDSNVVKDEKMQQILMEFGNMVQELETTSDKLIEEVISLSNCPSLP